MPRKGATPTQSAEAAAPESPRGPLAGLRPRLERPFTRDIVVVLLLALVTLLIFAPAIAPGRTLLPADLLLLTPPWKQHTAELAPGFQHVNRPAWDPLFQFYPARKFLAETLRAGKLPLWNPLAFSGTPFAADGQSAVFYPINWLFAVLPLASAFSILAALHTFLTGLFFYLFGKRVGWRRSAALTGAVIWMFCGVMTAWQMWQVVDATLCWLPATLYFWEGVRRAQSRNRAAGQAAGMAAALGLALLAGHLQFAFYVWIATVAYVLMVPVPGGRRRAFTGYAVALGSFALGAAAAAVQLLATADLLRHSLRAHNVYDALLSSGLHVGQLGLLLCPDLLGGLKDFDHYATLNYFELTCYCGAVGLCLAVYGALRSQDRRRAGYGVGLAAFALLLGCGTPLYAVLYYGVPMFKAFRGLSRTLCLFDFAVALLAAQGVMRLVQEPASARKQFAGRLFAAMAVLLLLLYRLAVSGNGPEVADLLTHGWLIFGLAQVGISLLLIALGCLILGKAPSRLAWLALPLAAVDMALFAGNLNVGADAALLYPPTPETQFVRRVATSGRVLCLGDDNPAHAQSRLVPNSAMAFGWHDVSGSDPLLLAPYDRLVSAINIAQTGASAPAGAGVIAAAGNPMLDRLNVRTIVSPIPRSLPGYRTAFEGDVNVYIRVAPSQPRDSKATPGPGVGVAGPRGGTGQPGTDRVATGQSGGQPGESTATPADARVVTNWALEPSADRARSLLCDSRRPFPPDTVLLSARADFAAHPAIGALPTVLQTGAEPHAAYGVNAATQALLVTSTIAAPGWRLSVNGKPAAPLVADTVFLAASLRPGNNQIRLDYQPASLQVGLFMSFVACSVFSALCVFSLTRKNGVKSLEIRTETLN